MRKGSRLLWAKITMLVVVTALLVSPLNLGSRLSSVDVVPSVQGGSIPLFANDSAVVLLFTTAECPITRLHTQWYRDLSARLAREGIAFRAVVRSSPVAAGQFARLLGEPVTIRDDGALSQRGGIQAVPTLRLYDAERKLRAEWPTPTSRARVDSLIRDAGVRIDNSQAR